MRKPTLKIDRFQVFVDTGFLQFFRVVSSDYGKPRTWVPMAGLSLDGTSNPTVCTIRMPYSDQEWTKVVQGRGDGFSALYGAGLVGLCIYSKCFLFDIYSL